MKTWNRLGRLLTFTLLVALLISVFIPAAAADSVGSITVTNPVDQVNYRIYRVGSYENGVIEMDKEFRDVNLDDDLLAAAATIAERLGDEKPLAEGVTSGGKVKFSNLSRGIYLISGDPFTYGSSEYHPVSTLVSVPMVTDGKVDFDVTVAGKYRAKSLIDISVMKVWKSDTEDIRPQSITVQLMCNGENYGPAVVLNKDNDWRYIWKNLSSTDSWYVQELAIPQGYTSVTTRVQNTFVITNTRVLPPPTNPPYNPPLPQTGQLWWPVYGMSCLGLLFVAMGLIRRRKSEENA